MLIGDLCHNFKLDAVKFTHIIDNADISVICPRFNNAWVRGRNIAETVCSTFRIRNIRRTYDHIKHISLCVNRNMAFSTGDLLSAIEAALTYACRCFDRLAIDNTGGWFDIAFLRLSRFCQDKRMEGDNCPIFRPFLDIIANNSLF